MTLLVFQQSHVIGNDLVDILVGVDVDNKGILLDKIVGAVYIDVDIKRDDEIVVIVIIVVDDSFDV